MPSTPTPYWFIARGCTAVTVYICTSDREEGLVLSRPFRALFRPRFVIPEDRGDPRSLGLTGFVCIVSKWSTREKRGKMDHRDKNIIFLIKSSWNTCSKFIRWHSVSPTSHFLFNRSQMEPHEPTHTYTNPIIGGGSVKMIFWWLVMLSKKYFLRTFCYKILWRQIFCQKHLVVMSKLLLPPPFWAQSVSKWVIDFSDGLLPTRSKGELHREQVSSRLPMGL